MEAKQLGLTVFTSPQQEARDHSFRDVLWFLSFNEKMQVQRWPDVLTGSQKTKLDSPHAYTRAHLMLSTALTCSKRLHDRGGRSSWASKRTNWCKRSQVNDWQVNERPNDWDAELHRSQSSSGLTPEQLGNHRGLLRVTKMRTLRMAMRRSLSEAMERIVSWARFSSGRTASSHQPQAGPLELPCRGEKVIMSDSTLQQ